MIHKLKMEPRFFQSVVNGTKTFEIRLNDRGFETGDYLYLEEYEEGSYSGLWILVKVGYIYYGGRDGDLVADNMCVMSISRVKIVECKEDNYALAH